MTNGTKIYKYSNKKVGASICYNPQTRKTLVKDITRRKYEKLLLTSKNNSNS